MGSIYLCPASLSRALTSSGSGVLRHVAVLQSAAIAPQRVVRLAGLDVPLSLPGCAMKGREDGCGTSA